MAAFPCVGFGLDIILSGEERVVGDAGFVGVGEQTGGLFQCEDARRVPDEDADVRMQGEVGHVSVRIFYIFISLCKR